MTDVSESIVQQSSLARVRPTVAPNQAVESRVGMDARAFRRSVVDHVLFTYARALRDSSDVLCTKEGLACRGFCNVAAKSASG